VNGTAESATTNWPNENVAGKNVFYNKSFELQDNSTYTWVGGSAGVWNVPANWERTTVGTLAATQPAGYPVFASTALFATDEGDDPITVTVPASAGTTRYNNETRWWVSTLNLDGMHEELIFTSEDIAAANCRFTPFSIIAKQTYNRLVFDDCKVYVDVTQNLGATAADANGENFTTTFTGGTIAELNNFKASYSGVKWRVEDGADLTIKSFLGGTSALPYEALEIDNGTVTVNSKVEPDNTDNGTLFRLMGAHSALSVQYFTPKRGTSTNVVEFVIPTGGYNAVPVQTTHNTYVLGSDTTKAPMTFRVSKDSPGLKSIGSRGIQLLYSKGGINAANVRFEGPKKGVFFFKDADGNEYADAAAIEDAGKTAAQITQIWYSGPAQSFTIIVR